MRTINPRHQRLPDFARRLNDLIRQCGGYLAVSADIGIPRNTLTQWGTGKHEPRLLDVAILALYFGVDFNDLMGLASSRIAEAKRLGVEDHYIAWADSREAAGFAYQLHHTTALRDGRYVRRKLKEVKNGAQREAPEEGKSD